MKHIPLLFACTTFAACSAADGDAYIPLERISVDDDSNEDRPTITIKTTYDGGIRAANQALNLSKRNLTSVHDLPKYCESLALSTLELLNVCKNHLTSEDLGTILSNIHALKTLSMGSNKVKSVAQIPSHPNLETLLLNDNRIEQLEVAPFCAKLPKLRQLGLQDNRLIPQCITKVEGYYTAMEEAWFDHTALNEELGSKLITIFPNIASELCAGKEWVRKKYTKIEQAYDNCSECDDSGGCCLAYGLSPVLGGIIGVLLTAAIFGYGEPIFGIHTAIFSGIGIIAAPIGIRLGYRIIGYCKTNPKDRYTEILTRQIAQQPRLLELIEDNVEQIPAQEGTV